MHVALLSGFSVRVADQQISIRGVRARQTLAYLALADGATVSVDRLIDALWGDAPPASARNSIQRFISDLRRDLGSAGSRIQHVDQGYRLSVGSADRCDAVALEGDRSAARLALEEGHAQAAVDLLSAYPNSGEPLAGLDGADFIDTERHRLTELRVDCAELLAEGYLALNDPATALIVAQPFTISHPYRERVVLAGARALAAVGRSTDALETITVYRRRLGDELGLEPSPAVQHVELDILTHSNSTASTAAQHIESAELPRLVSTEMVGRSGSLASAIDAFASTQVITITGTGGVGKTTLATAVAQQWQHTHPTSVVRFVSLSEISSHGVTAAVGQSVGTSSKLGNDPVGEVLDRICAEVSLLVLDNCEHVLADVALLINQVVARSSSVRVLVTSRSPIGILHEQLFALEPLDDGASRDLLRQCLDHESIRVDDLNREEVDALLSQLDGLPLAIELASAGLRTVGLTELLARWETADLPSTNNAGRPARHLSIASVVRGTLDHLGTKELRLLRLCAMFPNDFDLSAVEAIGGLAAIEHLRSLVDVSLLEFRHGPHGARYRMLVPIRREIRLLLDENTEWRSAAITHYADVSRRSLEQVKGDTPLQGVNQLRAELTNIAFAFDAATESEDLEAMSDIVAAVGLANGMSPAVGAKSHLQDWTKRLRQVMASSNAGPALAAYSWRAAGWGLYGSGDGAWYLRWESETDADELECIAMAAIARFSQGERDQAWDILRRLDLGRLEDPFLRALLGGVGAVIAFEVGASAGDQLVELAVDAASAVPSRGATFFANLALVSQSFVRGDAAAAVARLDLLIDEIHPHGLETLENMGRAAQIMTVGVLLREEDPDENLIALIDRYLEQHSLDPGSVAMALDVAALRLHAGGKSEAAATLVGLLDRLGLSMAILRPARIELEREVDASQALSRARAAGSLRSTFEVLAATRSALFELSTA